MAKYIQKVDAVQYKGDNVDAVMNLITSRFPEVQGLIAQVDDDGVWVHAWFIPNDAWLAIDNNRHGLVIPNRVFCTLFEPYPPDEYMEVVDKLVVDGVNANDPIDESPKKWPNGDFNPTKYTKD